GVLQALGSAVSVFVRGQRLVDSFDAQLTAQLAEDYRQAGIHIHFSCSVEGVEKTGDGFRVIAPGASDMVFDQVLLATGRRPSTDAIGLDTAGVETDRRGHIVVDERLATTLDGIVTVGDVSTALALTPVAIAAARRLMDRLYGNRDRPLDPHDIPTVVFSHPPMGKVGLTEDQAREQHGDDVHVATASFRPMLHALV